MKKGYVLCSPYLPKVLALKKLPKLHESVLSSHFISFLAAFIVFCWVLTLQTLSEEWVRGEQNKENANRWVHVETPLESRRESTGLRRLMKKFSVLPGELRQMKRFGVCFHIAKCIWFERLSFILLYFLFLWRVLKFTFFHEMIEVEGCYCFLSCLYVSN